MRRILSQLLAVVMAVGATSLPMPGWAQADGVNEFWGQPKEGLQPHIFFFRTPADWGVRIDMYHLTNFPPYTWLKVTNRTGATVRLWLTNGAPVWAVAQDAVLAERLPMQTTVKEVMKGVPRYWRGNLWLLTESRSRASAVAPPAAYNFNLSSTFGMAFTNDCFMSIHPLFYKVKADGTNASLVIFPELKVKLKGNGVAEQMLTH